jgi:hypothetical protein
VSYDTEGIRRMLARKPLTFDAAGELVHGLGLNDLDGSGADVPELALDADVHVYAGVDVPLASA